MQQDTESKFQVQILKPFSTFRNGLPERTPYVVDGLLMCGGFSILGARPKLGKSSLARFAATCISKGQPFLGRQTVQGESLLISLEDPIAHVDNHLKVLGYNAKNAPIHIVEKMPGTLVEAIEVLGDALTRLREVRFVVIDTLAKFLRVRDLNDYVQVMEAVEKLHDMARRFPHLHIQGLAHTKKLKTDDVFDGLLGSTALRGEPDASLALYSEQGQRVIASEVRIGRNIAPSILHATMVEHGGSDLVAEFSLDRSFDDWKDEQSQKSEKRRAQSYEQRIITFLSSQENEMATQRLVTEEVQGRKERILAAITNLTDAKVLVVTGKKNSPLDPIVLKLDRSALRMHDFIDQYGGHDK